MASGVPTCQTGVYKPFQLDKLGKSKNCVVSYLANHKNKRNDKKKRETFIKGLKEINYKLALLMLCGLTILNGKLKPLTNCLGNQ